MAQPFPFAAIVAQEDMKKALLMAAVEPLLGGVLIFGIRMRVERSSMILKVSMKRRPN